MPAPPDRKAPLGQQGQQGRKVMTALQAQLA